MATAISVLSSIISDTSAVVAMKERSVQQARAWEVWMKSFERRRARVSERDEGRAPARAILDPLSKEAQRVAPENRVAREIVSATRSRRRSCSTRSIICPSTTPSYYRYVVPTMSAEEAPKAIITNVPTPKRFFEDARRFPRGVDGDDAQGIVRFGQSHLERHL